MVVVHVDDVEQSVRDSKQSIPFFIEQRHIDGIGSHPSTCHFRKKKKKIFFAVVKYHHHRSSCTFGLFYTCRNVKQEISNKRFWFPIDD